MKERGNVSECIDRLARLKLHAYRDHVMSYGLQPVQFDILHYLSMANQYSNTPLAVAEFLLTTKGTISQSIKQLEMKGFIIKVPDAKDKRSVHLQLTEQAEECLHRFAEKDPIEKALQSTSSNQLEASESFLRELLKLVQKHNDHKVFGVCKTCRHFIKTAIDGKFQCGLTKESLSETASLKWCREHENAL